MIKLKINFSDFWPDFDKTDNFIFNLLCRHYDIEISNNPDILFFSCYSFNYKKYNCKRVLYLGENRKPNFSIADYVISFEHLLHPRHYRLPLYAIADKKYPIQNLLKQPNFQEAKNILSSKSKFCAYIVSNGSCVERNEIFQLLNKYKKVDSIGRHLNNLGYFLPSSRLHDFDVKRDFIKDYKFVIAFENTSSPGYITEKIIHPKQVQSIPIYWGDPNIARELNSKSFINYFDYKSMDKVVERVIEMDTNDSLYIQTLMEPFYINNILNSVSQEENFLNFLRTIIHSTIKPVANKPINRLKSNSMFQTFVKMIRR